MQKHTIKTMRLIDLKPADYNPRKMSKEAMTGLQASLNRFGLVQPIVWNNRTKRIVGGHQRVTALIDAGETEAPVVVVNLGIDDEKALNITLNNPHVAGEFTAQLQGMLNDLQVAMPQLFPDLQLDKLIADLTDTGGQSDQDEIPTTPKKPVTKKGDLWVMGKHRVLCADSSKQGMLQKLMGHDEADMCFTDPPYGIDYGAKNRFLNSFQPSARNLKDIANDMIGKDQLLAMLVASFTAACGLSRDHCSYYVTAPQGGELGLMMMMMMMSGLPTRHVLIWNKDSQNFSLGRLDYEYKHEPILYAWKKTHKFYGGGAFKNSVWDIPKPRKAAEHPTMKPVELVENAILNSSQRGQIIIDMFGGSGTTIIAAQKTGRRARLCEIDPSYVDVIIERWEKFTGQKAKRQ